jgi:hypothetical protein
MSMGRDLPDQRSVVKVSVRMPQGVGGEAAGEAFRLAEPPQRLAAQAWDSGLNYRMRVMRHAHGR